MTNKKLLTMTIYSEFSHWKWWFSIFHSYVSLPEGKQQSQTGLSGLYGMTFLGISQEHGEFGWFILFPIGKPSGAFLSFFCEGHFVKKYNTMSTCQLWMYNCYAHFFAYNCPGCCWEGTSMYIHFSGTSSLRLGVSLCRPWINQGRSSSGFEIN